MNKIVLSGNLVKETKNIEKEETDLSEVQNESIQNEEAISVNEESPKIQEFSISGGGMIVGDLPWVEKAIGNNCESWGNAFCQDATTYSGKVELKCPVGYEGKLIGMNKKNFESSEDVQTRFICIADFLTKRNNSLYSVK